jgi:hypothetical protein
VDMGAELRPESRHIASMAELSRKELWLDHVGFRGWQCSRDGVGRGPKHFRLG